MIKKVLLLSLFALVNLYGISFSKVQISGDINYEIEKVQNDGTNDGVDKEAEHDIDLDLKFAYPFTKESEFVIKVDDDNQNDENGSALDLRADQIYLTYQQKDKSAQLGLQEISGPFFYEKNGDGLLFLKSFGTNIAAVSYYINNTFSKADEVMQAAIIGEANAINYSLWYSKIQDSDETSHDYGSDAFQVSIYKQSDMFKLGISYSTLDSSSSSTRTLKGEQSQAVIFMNNADKTIKYGFAYIITGKDGGNVALDEDTDSEANYSLDEVGANDVVDGDSYYAMISKEFGGTNYFVFEYFNGDGTTSAEELKLTFKTYLYTDLFCYASANQWDKTGEETSEKVEIGFNISF